MNDWPPLNALVWLRLPCCNAEHPTRVEDYPGDGITVAAPVAPHTRPVAPLPPNEGFFIGWAMERGALEVPVVLREHSEGNVPFWTLKAVGPPVETQRREFVRVAVDFEVKLHFVAGGAPATATLVDLSEGGLRCLVDKWAIEPGNRTFTVELPLEGDTLVLRGQVVWWGNLDERSLRTVGLRFIDTPKTQADRIRRFAFATQLEQRRRHAL